MFFSNLQPHRANRRNAPNFSNVSLAVGLFALIWPLCAPAQYLGVQTPIATPSSNTQLTTPNTQQNRTAIQNNSAQQRSIGEADGRRATETQAPLPPTEFQRLVNQTTGLSLPIFGSSLFSGVPSTFAPADDIPVTSDYMVGPGDEIRIQLYGQVNQQGSFTVDRNGDISFPEVGTLHVAGVRYAQLQGFLRSQFSRVYRNFELNVNMGQLRSMQVFVVGQARRPGAYTVSSLSTLLNALFASGGALPQGSLRDIQVQRAGKTIVHFDLYDLLLHGDKTKDVPLQPGDVIFIPPVGSQVAVVGSVGTQAIYETVPGTTVDQTVALAGGRSSTAAGQQVRLDRVFEHTMRSVIDVDVARGQNPTVQNGDILTILAVTDQYKDAVTLRGNVTTPGRYVWHDGMHILDLVPSKDQLVTREYYLRRNALGNFRTTGTPPAQDAAQTAAQAAAATQTGAQTSGTTQPADNTQSTSSQGSTPPQGSGSLEVNGTTATRQADSAVKGGAAGTSSSGGGSLGSALTETNNIFQPINDVVLSAPDIDWSYAVIERMNPVTLATTLTPFSPGRLYLQGDQSQNLALSAGDVVTFFSTADLKVPTSQQTRFIRLEGEFAAPGIYSVEPGETLRKLIERAGGLTPEAYLYGSDFTRQSTRRVQQQRLAEYADSLESRLSVETASGNSRAVSSNDAAAVAASQQNGLEIVARLRRTVALGRIVLDVKPDSRGAADVPDVALEDGDRFIVPRVPSTVSVEGQVYSANAFLYQHDRKERDYLREAGGPDREADAKRTFILRADGSVYSEQYGNVSKARIFPGDTIVVPPKLQHPSLFRDLIDISTIVGQFGIFAAALSIL